MEVAQQRHNEPIWMILSRILYVWCLVFYRQAMRYLKGGRLFGCMRLEGDFHFGFESVLGAFNMKHNCQTWETRSHKKQNKLPCTAATHCNQSIQVLSGNAQWTQSFNVLSACPSLRKKYCRPGLVLSYMEKQWDNSKAVGSLSRCD